MESLEAVAEVKRSATGDREPARIKCPAEAAAALPELEGRRRLRRMQEGQSQSTCGERETTDSGNSQQAGEQSLRARTLSAGHKDYNPSPDDCQQPEDPSADTSVRLELQRSQKPGRYVCDYCGRACAKPSVLKKHIRSHTGERPYPCLPCGFSFKTKSNLYKHRKSHAHLVKSGSAPFSELGPFGAGEDQGSFEGEGEPDSDGDQTTDTDDDDGDPLLLQDYPTEAGSDCTAVKVLNLVAQRRGVGTPNTPVLQDVQPQLQDANASPGRPSPCRTVQSSAVKQRLALRLSEKRSSESEQNLSLPSQSSKGSTDSGYFSRSESAEHQTGPPNTNAKSYQEIMFGKCYRPSPKQMTAFTMSSQDSLAEQTRSERGVSRVFTQEKDLVEPIKITTKTYGREESVDTPMEGGADTGPLLRSNSMPTSSAICLSVQPCLRGSHSFDERATAGGMRRLRRQAAFEHSGHEGHGEADGPGRVPESGAGEVEAGAAGTGPQKYTMELATRKRRKGKREEDDMPGLYDPRGEAYEETTRFPMDIKDHDMKGAMGLLALRKGPCLHAQLDRANMELSVDAQTCGRKPVGNVISVIQHTNSLNRQHAPEPSESYGKYQGPRPDLIPTYGSPLEQIDSCEMESSVSAALQSFQMGPKLVRQSNIQVPEIRVTVEPDSPEKAPEVKMKEPEKHVEVEFQWPQRSETLAQFPPEKLPPKKKRLRLADIEHSSGESSFESACTSLSRSPSQDSNLSYSSAFSFDREEGLKSLSPCRQDEFGRPLELLAVPGSSHALSLLHQRQQHEMRRSASEQAPCDMRKEFPEVRSVSFDYGSLTQASKVRLADHGTSPSAARERRRGNLVRQESLNMDTELTQQVVSKTVPKFPGGIVPYAPTILLPTVQPTFIPGTYPSPPGMLVPVRAHTHLPSYGSITYTTVSQILDHQYDTVGSLTGGAATTTITALSQNQLRLFGTVDPIMVTGGVRLALNVEVLDLSSAKLKTGIPLSLTSRTISTTNASSGGTNKRMLSPASSLDLFMEVKQQKRVKEEKMFGQILEELSAVELGKCNLVEDKRQCLELQVVSSARAPDEPSRQNKLIGSILQSAADTGDAELAMDSSASERSTPPLAMATADKDTEACGKHVKVQMDTAAQPGARRGAMISGDLQPRPSQFPSLRTTTGVSWCYLNYAKPSSVHGQEKQSLSSVYATWCVSLHNPNPPEVSTSAALALLRSKQRQDTVLYTVAAMCQPGAGKLVSSLVLWRQKMEQLQRKPEIKEEGCAVVPVTAVTAMVAGGAVAAYGRKAKDASCRPRTAKEEWKERETTLSQALPTRVKIFDGGYKSNEEYVYVRGRGRGKYICEECGIRCKKPSMLKKHIRTHTDVRPYVCRVCNFAFKTKGNLTKHMKSKAHMKKCLEMGVSISMEDIEIQEAVEGGAQRESRAGPGGVAKHQFSDADDSDGADEDMDEIDEEDDDDEEYDGECTPKLRSRSTSPQPGGGVASLSVSASAALHGYSLATLPAVGGRRRSASNDNLALVALERRDRHVDEDSLTMLSPDQSCFLFDPTASCLLSPGWESPLREPSPSRLRYPSPRGRSSSPRWDGSSPLRPSSPGFSSPLSQHLLPVSAEKPLSPLSELAGRREPAAVRGRQRVVLRAMSPRRGAHQHRGPSGEKSSLVKVETPLQPLSQHLPEAFEATLEQRDEFAAAMPCSANVLQQNLLSHLPLHSQHPICSLLPLCPIGGVKMLHARSSSTCTSSSNCTSSCSSALSPQASETSMECGSLQEPLESGGEEIRAPDLERPSSSSSSPPASCSSIASPPDASRRSNEEQEEEQPQRLEPGGGGGGGVGADSGQEENVQTCVTAIASLKISAEELH